MFTNYTHPFPPDAGNELGVNPTPTIPYTPPASRLPSRPVPVKKKPDYKFRVFLVLLLLYFAGYIGYSLDHEQVYMSVFFSAGFGFNLRMLISELYK